MKVDLTNYEVLLLDYIEGQLGHSQTQLLMAFINQHPELGSWDELSGALPTLLAEKQEFSGKDALKQAVIESFGEINEGNYRFYFISKHEGLLPETMLSELDQFVQRNPFLADELAAFGHVYLKPDPTIVFPDASALKQHTLGLSPLYYRIITIAASLVLLISISLWFLPGKPDQIPVVISEQKAVEEFAAPIEKEVIVPPVQKPIETQPAQTALRREVSEALQKSSDRTEPIPSMTSIVANGFEHVMAKQPIYLYRGESYPSSNEILAFSENLSVMSQKRSVIGLVLTNAANKIMDGLFPGKSDDQLAQSTDKTKGFSLWNIASAGVNTYNKLTDKDVELTKAHDNLGNMTSFRFSSDKIVMNRNIRNMP
ncbi:MAG: hypothetical protein KGZ82_01315 [Bacteroidales bacterium]|nr:hypothetical protein [Bacteroidales bacterium]